MSYMLKLSKRVTLIPGTPDLSLKYPNRMGSKTTQVALQIHDGLYLYPTVADGSGQGAAEVEPGTQCIRVIT